MQRDLLRSFELILVASQQPLGMLELGWEPNPGGMVSWQGETYAILERRNRYQYIRGHYQLVRSALYVQPTGSAEARLVEGQWTLGDSSCRFNSRSPLIRCAVNPQGACSGCADYEPLTDSGVDAVTD